MPKNKNRRLITIKFHHPYTNIRYLDDIVILRDGKVVAGITVMFQRFEDKDSDKENNSETKRMQL